VKKPAYSAYSAYSLTNQVLTLPIYASKLGSFSPLA